MAPGGGRWPQGINRHPLLGRVRCRFHVADAAIDAAVAAREGIHELRHRAAVATVGAPHHQMGHKSRSCGVSQQL